MAELKEASKETLKLLNITHSQIITRSVNAGAKNEFRAQSLFKVGVYNLQSTSAMTVEKCWPQVEKRWPHETSTPHLVETM